MRTTLKTNYIFMMKTIVIYLHHRKQQSYQHMMQVIYKHKNCQHHIRRKPIITQMEVDKLICLKKYKYNTYVFHAGIFKAKLGFNFPVLMSNQLTCNVCNTIF